MANALQIGPQTLDEVGPDRPATADCFQLGEWLVEPDLCRISRRDRSVDLQHRVMALLCFFASNPKRVVGKDELAENVWSGLVVGDDAIVNSVVKLRKSLGDTAKSPDYIETIPKVGYRLIAEVRAVDSLSPTDSGSASADAAFAPNRSQMLRPALTVLLVISLAALSAAWWSSKPAPPHGGDIIGLEEQTVLAVLPLSNLSGGEETDYFADGLTEEIINRLYRYPRLKIPARTTTFALRDRRLSLEELAEILHAQFLLQGSVRRYEGAIRISVQLLDVGTQTQRWSRDYDRTDTDILQAQAEIADDIAVAMNMSLISGDDSSRSPLNREQFAALDLYWLAQHQLRERTLASIGKAITLLKTLLTDYPPDGRYHFALAKAYLLQSSYGTLSVDTAVELATAAWDRGIKLAPDAEEAKAIAGLLAWYRGDLPLADRLFRQLVEQHPQQSEAMLWLGQLNQSRGQLHDAAEWLSRAEQFDPLNLTIGRLIGRNLMSSGRFDEGLSRLETQLNPNASSAQLELELARWNNNYGHTTEALAWARKALAKEPEQVESLVAMAFGELGTGDRDAAFQWIQRAQLKAPSKPLVFSASVSLYFYAGDRQRLVEYVVDARKMALASGLPMPASLDRWWAIAQLYQGYPGESVAILEAMVSGSTAAGINGNVLDSLEDRLFLIEAYRAEGSNEKAEAMLVASADLLERIRDMGWGVPQLTAAESVLEALKDSAPNARIQLSADPNLARLFEGYLRMHGMPLSN